MSKPKLLRLFGSEWRLATSGMTLIVTWKHETFKLCWWIMHVKIRNTICIFHVITSFCSILIIIFCVFRPPYIVRNKVFISGNSVSTDLLSIWWLHWNAKESVISTPIKKVFLFHTYGFQVLKVFQMSAEGRCYHLWYNNQLDTCICTF